MAKKLHFRLQKRWRYKNVLYLVDSMNENKELIEDGWVHTSTIDPIVYLENLHNVRKIDTEL